jgi:hypothetical protein
VAASTRRLPGTTVAELHDRPRISQQRVCRDRDLVGKVVSRGLLGKNRSPPSGGGTVQMDGVAELLEAVD